MFKLNLGKLKQGNGARQSNVAQPKNKARVLLKSLVFSALFILAILAVFISQTNRAEAQISYFSGAATTGYRTTISIGQILLYDSITCKQIDARNVLNSINYFIPTKTSLEWLAFYNARSLFNITVSECGCAAGAVGGYSYGAITNGGTQPASRVVTNGHGTCSATINCSAANVASVAPGEYMSSCTAGYYDLNGSCADGCESQCGDGACNNGETTATCGVDCGCSPVGGTQTRYAALTNPACGTYAASQVQICQADYTFSPNNYSLTSSPTASTRNTQYTATSVACNASCQNQAQTCTSGGWSPSAYATCSPVTCDTAGICQSGGGCSSGTCAEVTNVSAGYDTYSECTASYNFCSGNNKIGPDGNCDGSGACKTGGQSTACSGGTPYCSSGSCVACTLASQCGTTGFITVAGCSGTQPQGTYRTFSCISNACSFADTAANYGTACSGGTPYCSGGSCVDCIATCSGTTPYCSGGSCVACTAASQCGTSGFITVANGCSGTQPQGTYRTFSCISNACSYADSAANYGTACSTASGCQGGGGCSSGACTAVTGIVAATTCTDGQYQTGCTCTTCPCGSYCYSGVNQGNCWASYYCPAGSSSFYAYSCTGGEYSNEGACSCSTCPAGSWCCSGQICGGLGNCYAGYYCPGGDTATSMLAQSCAAGYWSDNGASSCTHEWGCPAGSYCSGGTRSACPAGSYCPGIHDTQVSCPSSYYCPAGSSSPTPCSSGCSSSEGAAVCTGTACDAYNNPTSCNAGCRCYWSGSCKTIGSF